MDVANRTHRIIRLRDGIVEKDISLEKRYSKWMQVAQPPKTILLSPN